MTDLETLKSDPDLLRQALEQAGVEGWLGQDRRQCLCPFHQDKQSSAGIHRARDSSTWLFTCCGCQTTGDIFHVIALSRGVTDGDVIRQLNQTGELLSGLRPVYLLSWRRESIDNRPRPTPERLAADAEQWRAAADDAWLNATAADLGVTAEVLRLYRCGRHHFIDADTGDVVPCLTIPMYGADRRVCGVRYRATADAGKHAGKKKARFGGTNGLFLPEERIDPEVLWVTEGCTDPLALASLGLWAIGLPAARQGIDLAATYIDAMQPAAVVAMADDGEVGRASAMLVARAAGPDVRPVKVVPSPQRAKDVRAWLKGCRQAGVGDGVALRRLWATVAATRPWAPARRERVA